MRHATLIGDVVASRLVPDRDVLQQRVRAALQRVNAQVPPVQPLDVTLGDEFQGTYATVAAAARASLLVRLTLLPDVDTRYGLGWGGLTIFDPGRQPVSQDGPAWWAAREAIQHVHTVSGRRGHARGLRTWCVDRGRQPWPAAPATPATTRSATPPGRARPVADGPADHDRAAVLNAFLITRDEGLAQQSDRARSLLLGWLEGRNQHELALAEGITQSAVSQQLSRSGAYAVRDAHEALDRMAPWDS